MDVFQAMREMRAMRRLKPDPVPEGDLREIIEYATAAPSGGNAQGWSFIVVRDAELRAEIAKIYHRAVTEIYFASLNTGPLPHQTQEEWEALKRAVMWQGNHLAEAPVLIFPALRVGRADFANFTVAASMGGSIFPAVQNLLLACRAKGLGATLTSLHLFFEDEVNALLRLPRGVRTFAMIPVGYPLGKFGPTKRLPVDDVIVWDRYPAS
ncbi:hypothetical protein AYO38_06830 [bacterium SCGC AG-212-C10]|nr:hypothetical protein AYO38_06830 [bacterium SCGC AG-212-C10]